MKILQQNNQNNRNNHKRPIIIAINKNSISNQSIYF